MYGTYGRHTNSLRNNTDLHGKVTTPDRHFLCVYTTRGKGCTVDFTFFKLSLVIANTNRFTDF